MKPDHLQVAVVQMSSVSSSKENQENIQKALGAAASDGAQLVLLQELHNTPYFCQIKNPSNFDLAESIPGPSTQWLGDCAKNLNLIIVASLFEKRSAGLYHDTAVVIDVDGGIAGRYRKMHIPDDPGYHEKFYFTPGDLGFTPITTSIGKLGVLLCWDQWYPEAARLMALAGAELLLYPTAIGWDPADTKAEQMRQLDAWKTVQRSHAIANGIPVVVANRTGFEDNPSGATEGSIFWGNSFIAGAQGEMLAEAENDTNEIISAELDLSHSETVRRIWPFLRDRRIDAYHDLSKRFIDTD